jgi:hypothetical protein
MSEMWGIDLASDNYNEGFIDCFRCITEKIEIKKEDFDDFVVRNRDIFKHCKVQEKQIQDINGTVELHNIFERRVFLALNDKRATEKSQASYKVYEGKKIKFRKKPVIIEAIKLTKESMAECYKFIGNNFMENWATDGTFINIKTLEGGLRASLGDWIIKGVSGEFYPCKPDIFEKTYEAI